MSDKDKKVTQDLNEGVDKTTKINEEDKTSKNELNAETLLHQKLAANEKNEVLKSENTTLKEEIEALKGKTNTNIPKDAVNSDVTNDRLNTVEFTMRHQDLTPEAIQAVLSVAKMNGISNEDALKEPMIDAYISKTREDAKIKNAIPTGNRSATATDEEKDAAVKAVDTARLSGKAEDWAKVIGNRIN